MNRTSRFSNPFPFKTRKRREGERQRQRQRYGEGDEDGYADNGMDNQGREQIHLAERQHHEPVYAETECVEGKAVWEVRSALSFLHFCFVSTIAWLFVLYVPYVR